MDFYYPPIELEKLRQLMVKKYNRRNLYKGKDKIELEFKELLFKLTALEKAKVNSFAYKVSSEHLLMLASYLPYNDYKLDLTNIMRTLEYRYKNRFLDASYRAYQFSLGNTEFFNWFRDNLLKNEHYRVSSVVDAHDLYMLFTKKNKVLSFAKYGLEKSLSFNQLLEKLHIIRTSLLANEIDKYYLILAGKEIYLKLGSAELLRRSSKFSLEEYGLLLNNYLKVLEKNMFHEQFLLRMYDYFEDPHQSNSVIWEYVEEDQKRKYMKWLGTHHIHTILGNDERTTFWKKYINSAVCTFMNEEKGRLALDFGKYVAVEFKQTGHAAYVYPSEIFYDRFAQYFDSNNTSSHAVLRDKMVAVVWLSHRGKWQYKFSDELLRLGIRR